jgi:Protein of unknown function (DUF3800)
VGQGRPTDECQIGVTLGNAVCHDPIWENGGFESKICWLTAGPCLRLSSNLYRSAEYGTHSQLHGMSRLACVVFASNSKRILPRLYGFSPAFGKVRLPMLLQGYFDDSGTHEGKNADCACVLAGFISTVDKWKIFSTAWASKLDEYPGLAYFRMSEAMSLRGQFAGGWTPELRDQRIFELAEIIKTHALIRVDCTMNRGWYNSLIRSIPDEWDDPYYLLFTQLLFAVQEHQMQHDNVDCDLIFDIQGNIGPNILSRWEQIQEYEPNETRRKLMDNRPTFRDDRQFLPLQAADMYAWLLRDHLSHLIKEQKHPRLPKKRTALVAITKQIRELEYISKEYDFEVLMRMRARMMVERAKRLGVL